MTKLSRRHLLTGGVAAAAGVTGLAIGDRFGLVPPGYKNVYGLGETLTYASQRLLTANSMAREFPRSEISPTPFANGSPPKQEEFKSSEAAGFSDWHLEIDGLVARPSVLSLDEIKNLPKSSQITQLICEEGWSFIAEWIGTPLVEALESVGVLPQARYVVYSSIQPNWSGSIDLADALHPQTLLTYGMNGADLPVGHGGPLRLRVPRQMGYKSVKYITRITVTETLKGVVPESGTPYSWYAGI